LRQLGGVDPSRDLSSARFCRAHVSETDDRKKAAPETEGRERTTRRALVVSYLRRGKLRRADAGRGAEEEAKEHGGEECPVR
jgi:hypothetical protein